MKSNKFFNILYCCINVLFIFLVICVLSPIITSVSSFLDIWDFDSVISIIIAIALLAGYTFLLIQAKKDQDSKKKWQFITEITSSDKIKKTVKEYELDSRITIIIVVMVLFVIKSLVNIAGSIILLIALLFYTVIASTCIDMFKCKKTIWKFKDCFAGIMVLIFLIVSTIIFVINYNIIGEAGIMGTPPVHAAMYYLETSLIPWILFDLYTFIRIKELKKEQALLPKVDL